ncbi:DUF4198 domain-containing protein [Alkalisalibacterium limincola]|uniref:DUF4198 domain-containing protein n=1 Tax=Alkalisalibacterium limincola TaxID=2699169 RepID=A0A5C8KY14_9GAMM|nr:DUF4198 domain-containing protein [Alkalisalibacterium limincola]TXK65687.1 DUF4198 domain-containing protein [Alkalisalibacterium limincola]
MNTGNQSTALRARVRHVAVGTLVAGVLAAMPALAHDFWLTAEQRNQDGSPVLRMWVGHEMEAEEERPYEAVRSQTLRMYHEGRTVALPQRGADGAVPFYALPEGVQGPLLVAMERPEVVLELPEPRFDHYLAEERLADIQALRREGAEAGPERYTRYLKVLVGPFSQDVMPPEEVGQRLEIVVDELPAQPAPGAKLQARVLFEGAPLPGRSVVALWGGETNGSTGSQLTQVEVTDEAGRVSFAYEKDGVWMLRLVHMRACEACSDVRWEGFWAAHVIQPDWITPSSAD